MNGENNLEVFVFNSWENLSLINDRDFIRVVNLDDNSFESFRIKINKDIRSSKNVLMRRLFCEHLKYDMLEEVYTEWSPFVQASPTVIFREILTDSTFSVGTMSSSTLMDITLRFTSILDLLVEVQNVLGTDLVVNEDKTVSFITRGLDRGARIRYAKNLKGIQKTRDGRGVANKIYGFGGGSPPAEIGHNTLLDIQGAEHVVTAISGATITAHSRLVSSDDDWNGFYAETTRSLSAVIGSAVSIVDSISPNQIVLNSAFTNLTVGDYFRINENVDQDPLKFIKDKESIDALGEIKRAIIYNDIVIASNFIYSSDLSGNYVDDGDGPIDDRWVSGGATIALSKNTNSAFILNGNLSLHIDSAATGALIGQTVVLNLVGGADDNFSMAIWVFLISGKVELLFFHAGDEHPFVETGERAETSTTGVWIQLLVEGLTLGSINSGVLRIKAKETSEFYLDSVIFEKAPKISSPTDFYKISGARRIWDRTFDSLQRVKNISNKYTVNLIDLHEVDPDSYPYDLILVGDTVTVQDDELSIDISARVQSKRWNIFEPQEAFIEIDNFSDRLSRRLSSEKRDINANLFQLTQNLGLIKLSRTLEPIAITIGQQKADRNVN